MKSCYFLHADGLHALVQSFVSLQSFFLHSDLHSVLALAFFVSFLLSDAILVPAISKRAIMPMNILFMLK